MTNEYTRVVLFDGEALAITLTLDDAGEPVIKDIKSMDELNSIDQLAALGIKGQESGEFVITPFA
jgi:hypothetical protein